MIDSASPLVEADEPVQDEDDLRQKILERAQKDWRRCEDRWRDPRLAYVEDVKFARLGEQWAPGLREDRARKGRPALTINKLPPFIRQVVNDARQNKPSIKVLPQDSEADPKTAQIYSGLIRNIETSSDADVAYDTALECAASGGFGFFRINLAYVDDASFEQDIVFERIGNPLTVYPDPDTQAADSSDWNICFVAEMMPKDAFEAKYPDADPIDFEMQKWPAGWREGEKVLVAEYWRRELVPVRLILLTNGQTVEEDAYMADPMAYVDEGTGFPAEPAGPSRTIERHEVVQYLVTGVDVLEENRWAGKWIPIVPVYGEEVNVEGERIFRSLIRDAKDAQVAYNVSRSSSAEFLALAPKAPFIGPKGTFATDQAKWETANNENHAYIEYDGPAAPQRMGVPSPATGPLQEALTASDEMKSIIGIYDAGMGARSNEVSGRAIMARQRESDTSTFHFIDNLSRAIRCAGRIIIDLIPKVYTPGRIIRVLGEDGTPETVNVGTPEQAQMQQQAATEQQATMQAVYALGTGRYDLTVSVGPAFNSRREEALTNIIELIRAYPPLAEIAGDLILKMQDFPYADELRERVEQQMARAQQEQGQPQQPQQAPDPAKMLDAQTRQWEAQTKAAQGQEKLSIDAYNAETQRLRAAHTITQPSRLRVPAQGNFAGG